jgi:hypothetical protein
MARERRLSEIVLVNEASPLKIDLNRGIASLTTAPDNAVRPHICLNDLQGVKLIELIALDPDSANTSIYITEKLNYGANDGAWLNLALGVYLKSADDQPGTIWSSATSFWLSPRQTGYIIKNLPPDSRQSFIGMITAWYQREFLPGIKKALAAVEQQLTAGDPLAEGVHENRIFDIHKGKEGHEGVEYTEVDVIGEKLFYKFFLGHTCLHVGHDGYNQVDELLLQMERERKEALGGMMAMFRELHQ